MLEELVVISANCCVFVLGQMKRSIYTYSPVECLDYNKENIASGSGILVHCISFFLQSSSHHYLTIFRSVRFYIRDKTNDVF